MKRKQIILSVSFLCSLCLFAVSKASLPHWVDKVKLELRGPDDRMEDTDFPIARTPILSPVLLGIEGNTLYISSVENIESVNINVYKSEDEILLTKTIIIDEDYEVVSLPEEFIGEYSVEVLCDEQIFDGVINIEENVW